MRIATTKVKKYNSSWQHVVTVDGTPIAVADSNNRANSIVSYLMGVPTELNDGTLKKELDRVINGWTLR